MSLNISILYILVLLRVLINIIKTQANFWSLKLESLYRNIYLQRYCSLIKSK